MACSLHILTQGCALWSARIPLESALDELHHGCSKPKGAHVRQRSRGGTVALGMPPQLPPQHAQCTAWHVVHMHIDVMSMLVILGDMARACMTCAVRHTPWQYTWQYDPYLPAHVAVGHV